MCLWGVIHVPTNKECLLHPALSNKRVLIVVIPVYRWRRYIFQTCALSEIVYLMLIWSSGGNSEGTRSSILVKLVIQTS